MRKYRESTRTDQDKPENDLPDPYPQMTLALSILGASRKAAKQGVADFEAALASHAYLKDSCNDIVAALSQSEHAQYLLRVYGIGLYAPDKESLKATTSEDISPEEAPNLIRAVMGTLFRIYQNKLSGEVKERDVFGDHFKKLLYFVAFTLDPVLAANDSQIAKALDFKQDTCAQNNRRIAKTLGLERSIYAGISALWNGVEEGSLMEIFYMTEVGTEARNRARALIALGATSAKEARRKIQGPFPGSKEALPESIRILTDAVFSGNHYVFRDETERKVIATLAANGNTWAKALIDYSRGMNISDIELKAGQRSMEMSGFANFCIDVLHYLGVDAIKSQNIVEVIEKSLQRVTRDDLIILGRIWHAAIIVSNPPHGKINLESRAIWILRCQKGVQAAHIRPWNKAGNMKAYRLDFISSRFRQEITDDEERGEVLSFLEYVRSRGEGEIIRNSALFRFRLEWFVENGAFLTGPEAEERARKINEEHDADEGLKEKMRSAERKSRFAIQIVSNNLKGRTDAFIKKKVSMPYKAARMAIQYGQMGPAMFDWRTIEEPDATIKD